MLNIRPEGTADEEPLGSLLIDFDAPLPNQLGYQEEGEDLIGLTERYGGDPQYGIRLLGMVGLSYAVAEDSILAYCVPAGYMRKIGLARFAQARLVDAYTNPHDLKEILVFGTEETFDLTRYFASLNRIFMGRTPISLESATGNLCLQQPVKGKQQDTALELAKAYSTSELTDNLFAAEALAASVGLERGEAADITKQLRDSLINYLAKTYIAGSIVAAMGLLLAGTIDIDPKVENGFREGLAGGIYNIARSDLPRSNKLSQIRKLYTNAYNLADTIFRQAVPGNAKAEKLHVYLQIMLSRVVTLVEFVSFIKVDDRNNAVLDNIVSSLDQRIEAPKVPPKSSTPEKSSVSDIGEARTFQQQGRQMAGDWQVSAKEVKQYPGSSKLSHLLRSGENEHRIPLGGIPRELTQDVLATLVIIQERSTLGLSANEIEAALKSAIDQFTTLETAFDKRLNGVRPSERSVVGAFPRLNIQGGVQYLCANRNELVRAVNACKFGDYVRLAPLINELFKTPND